MESVFKVGDKVTAVSFTDSYGRLVPVTRGLTVHSLRLIEHRGDSLKPYYRLTAYGEGLSMVEGAERFFERAE